MLEWKFDNTVGFPSVMDATSSATNGPDNKSLPDCGPDKSLKVWWDNIMLTLLRRHSLAKPNHDEDDEEDNDGAAHQGDQSDHYFHTDINLWCCCAPAAVC